MVIELVIMGSRQAKRLRLQGVLETVSPQICEARGTGINK